MKKAPIVLLMLVMIATLMVIAAGCGGDDTGYTEEMKEQEKASKEAGKLEENEVEVVDTNEPVSEGIVGEYAKGLEPKRGTDAVLLTINGDGTFSGTAWGASRNGTYKLSEGTTNSIVLTFSDGTTETWSIMIGYGKVWALGSPDGEQLTKLQ